MNEREDLENGISYEFTVQKADVVDISFHIRKATGKEVDAESTDDALETLSLEDLRKLLHHLRTFMPASVG